LRKFWNILFYSLNILVVVTSLFFATLPPASAMEVKLTWDNNKENDLAGYKVYCDTNPNIAEDFCINKFSEIQYDLDDLTKTVSITVPIEECPFWINLPISNIHDQKNPICELILNTPDNSQVYYFVVSAYDTQGLESLPSNEVNTVALPYDNDECPNDPDKTEPGVCGCGTPDIDNDGDGTLDCKDGCSNDAGKIAPGVCGCGVSDNDTDTDGTPDCIDNCPNDPDKTESGICGCGISDEGPEGCGFVDTDRISAFEMGIQGITAVVYDEQRDFLWVGTDEGELFAFDLQVQKLEGNYTDNIGLGGDPIISMRMDNEYLLIETDLNGEIKFNPETNGNRQKGTGNYSDTETEEGFGMNLGDVISEIEEGFGINSGDFISEIEERLSINLEYSEINGIHIAGDCNVFKYWLATNLGIVAVNEDFAIMHITTENSTLADNRVYCMVEDVTGNLWFGTQIGLCKVDFSMPRVTDFYLITDTDTDSDYDIDYNSYDNDTENVGLMELIKISFSESMDQVSVLDNLSIVPMINLEYSWNEAGTSLTLTPIDSMDTNENYTVTLRKQASDFTGNMMCLMKDAEFSFFLPEEKISPVAPSQNKKPAPLPQASRPYNLYTLNQQNAFCFNFYELNTNCNISHNQFTFKTYGMDTYCNMVSNSINGNINNSNNYTHYDFSLQFDVSSSYYLENLRSVVFDNFNWSYVQPNYSTSFNGYASSFYNGGLNNIFYSNVKSNKNYGNSSNYFTPQPHTMPNNSPQSYTTMPNNSQAMKNYYLPTTGNTSSYYNYYQP